jgi:hypothetical protein
MAAPWEVQPSAAGGTAGQGQTAAIPAGQVATTAMVPTASGAPWEVKQGLPTLPSPGWGPIPGSVIDLGKNIVTGIETGVADVAGMPRALQDFINQYIPPDPGSWAANPNDPRNPPTQPDVRKAIVGQTGLDYVPSTPEGRIVQRAAEFGGPAILGGPLAAGFAATGGAAEQGLKEAGAPPWAQTTAGIVVPLLAHTGVTTTKTLLRPTREAGQEAAAQQIIDQVAANPDAESRPPPISGAPQTLGQARGDDQLLAFEQHRFQSSPNQTEFTKIKTGANQAAANELQNVGNFPNRSEAGPQMLQAGTGMHQEVKAGLDAAHSAEHAAWTGIDPTNSTAFDTVALNQKVDDYLNSLTKARRQYVPTDEVATIKSFAPTEPLMEMQDLRSTLSTQARDLRAGGKTNQANVVEGLRDVVANHVDNMVMPTPDLATKYENARLLTQQLHATYDVPQVQRVLHSPTPSAAAPLNFMNSPEGFDAYYKATNGSPEAIQHAQDYFLAGMARKSLGGGDQLAAKSYVDYLNKPVNQALLNDRRLFTQDQADNINRVAAQLDHTMQTERAGTNFGSQTYKLLSGGEQTKALVGQTGAAAANILDKAKMAAGAYIGAHFWDFSGSMIGAGLSRLIGGPSYAKAGEKVLAIVDHALRDPAFADQLRQRARNLPSTSATLAPALKGTAASGLSGLLGGP